MTEREVTAGRSIQSAIDVSVDGDIINVFTDEYHEVLHINKKITVQAAPGEIPIIDGKHILPKGNVIGTDPKSGKTYVYEGLVDVTEGGTFSGFNVRNSLGRGIRVFKNDGANVSNNIISYSRSSGILVFNSALIFDNEIFRSGDYATYSRASLTWPMALMLRGKNITAQKNHVHHNWGEGIGIGRGADTVNIINNISENNFALQIYLDHAQNIRIDNNTCLFDDPEFFRGGSPPESIAVNNEIGVLPDYLNKNIVVTNNKATGGLWNFGLWCQQGKWGTSDLYVADNEFRDGIEGGVRVIAANEIPHSNVVIEKNKIFQSTGIPITKEVPGVTIRDNIINPTPDDPPEHDHQEILDRLDTLDKAYGSMALEQAEMSVKLQAQEGNIEDLAQVQGAQGDRIEILTSLLKSIRDSITDALGD